jgi:carbonic anhydrase/acetyltransferase-like protein (isoleucine patch superfamily)
MTHRLGDLRPALAPDVWIAPGAVVVGRVTVGPGSSFWFGAVARGDNEPMTIGARTNVQENAVLHSDTGFALTIGDDCTIGHGAIVHGCTVEDGCLIGMGAIILNGAVIGAGSLIGAGALVTEGKVIPPGSVVMGSPGRVVKELDAAGRARLLASAAGYAANARRFAAGLAAVPDQARGGVPGDDASPAGPSGA